MLADLSKWKVGEKAFSLLLNQLVQTLRQRAGGGGAEHRREEGSEGVGRRRVSHEGGEGVGQSSSRGDERERSADGHFVMYLPCVNNAREMTSWLTK